MRPISSYSTTPYHQSRCLWKTDDQLTLSLTWSDRRVRLNAFFIQSTWPISRSPPRPLFMNLFIRSNTIHADFPRSDIGQGGLLNSFNSSSIHSLAHPSIWPPSIRHPLLMSGKVVAPVQIFDWIDLAFRFHWPSDELVSVCVCLCLSTYLSTVDKIGGGNVSEEQCTWLRRRALSPDWSPSST